MSDTQTQGKERSTVSPWRIPEDTYRKLRVGAAQRGLTIKAAIGQAIEEWVESRSDASAA